MLKNVQDEGIRLAIVAAIITPGSGRGTANIFRNMFGLPEAKRKEKEKNKNSQKFHTAHTFRFLILKPLNYGIFVYYPMGTLNLRLQFAVLSESE
jgi:hypothetical protein